MQTLIISIALGYLGLCALVYFFQRSFLYFPAPYLDHAYTTQIFHNESETINVIVLNQGEASALLYFGGNGEAVVNNAPNFTQSFPNHTVYLVNYRGYGGSSGHPSEDAIYADALHIFDQIKTKHPQISIIGRSLGTGVATYIGAERSVNKIALITPFDSIERVARTYYSLFPTSLLLKDKYDSISRAKQINSPVLIILAEHDSVIPFKHSKPLIDAFPEEQLHLATISGAGHNDISLFTEYHTHLREYLR